MDDLLIWGLILLVLSAGLLVIEVFVPTAGVLAITSTALAVAGVICLWRFSNEWGLGGLLTMMVVGPGIAFYGLKIYQQTPLGRKMTGADTDEKMAEDHDRLAEQLRSRRQLIGKAGVVITELRPVGVIEVEGLRHDALSETTLIRAGARVRITGVEPGHVKVRGTDERPSEPA